MNEFLRDWIRLYIGRKGMVAAGAPPAARDPLERPAMTTEDTAMTDRTNYIPVASCTRVSSDRQGVDFSADAQMRALSGYSQEQCHRSRE